MIDPKKADSYLRELLGTFEKERDKLDPHVRRLILKYQETQAQGDRVTNEIEQLRNQLKQGEARLRSMELQATAVLGKAAGCLEVLVSMKFEEEADLDSKKPSLIKPAVLEKKRSGQERKAS